MRQSIFVGILNLAMLTMVVLWYVRRRRRYHRFSNQQRVSREVSDALVRSLLPREDSKRD
jgi:CHASE3 domain sensor protein